MVNEVIRWNVWSLDEHGDKASLQFTYHAECSAREMCGDMNEKWADKGVKFDVFKQLRSGRLWLDMV